MVLRDFHFGNQGGKILKAFLSGLIETPECDHPLRTDIATEFQKDYKSFVKSAEDHAKKHAPRS